MRALLVAASLAVSFGAAGVAAADGPPEPPVGVPRCEIWWEDTALTHNVEPLPQPQQPSSVWCDY